MKLTPTDRRFLFWLCAAGIAALTPWVYLPFIPMENIMQVQRITTMEDETFDSIVFAGTLSECEEFIDEQKRAGNVTCFDAMLIVP
jgi:hypothetical protein